ncbi:unnamed protein product [Wickerhamomyces anomalus]
MSSNSFNGLRLLRLRNKDLLAQLRVRSGSLVQVKKISYGRINTIPSVLCSTSMTQRFMSTSTPQPPAVPSREVGANFLKLLFKEEHTVEEIDRLYALSLDADLTIEQKTQLFKLLAENDRVDQARSILEGISMIGLTFDYRKAIANFAGQVDSIQTVSNMASRFRRRFKGRDRALTLLEIVTTTYLEFNKPERALESWVIFVTHNFNRSKLHSAHNAVFFREVLYKILEKSKGVDFEPIVDAHVPFEDRHFIYRSFIQSARTKDNPALIYDVFKRIPRKYLVEKSFQYVSRTLACDGEIRLVSELLTEYPQGMELEQRDVANFYRYVSNHGFSLVYKEYLRISEVYGGDPPRQILRDAIGKAIRSSNMSALKKLCDVYKGKYNDMFTYHSFMAYYLQVGKPSKFFHVFREMANAGYEPDIRSYNLIFQQFSAKKDLESTFALLDYLTGKGMKVTIEELCHVLVCCAKQIDVDSATKVDQLADKYELKKTGEFYSSLMAVYTEANLHEKAIELFNSYDGPPNADLYANLIKTHVRKGDYDSAREAYKSMMEQNIEMTRKFYAVLIEYFCKIGEFTNARTLMDSIDLEDGNDMEPFAVMMENYMQKGLHAAAISVYNFLLENNVTPGPRVYNKLMECLVQLSFVNNHNFSRPARIAEELLATQKENPKKHYLSFKIIKPLVRYLSKQYDPVYALKLLEDYKSSRSEYSTSKNISILKEELIIYGETKQFYRFNAVFENFLDEIKRRMVRGKRPHKSKDVFLPIIGYRARSGAVLDEQKQLQDLVQNFIFAHNFNVSNENLNEIADILLADSRTFMFGMEIVETKLMGGFIAHAVVRAREWRNSVLPLGANPIEYQNPITMPKIYLKDEFYLKIAIHLDNYLSMIRKMDPNKMGDFMEKFRIKFPKVFKNFPGTISNFADVEGYDYKKDFRDSGIANDRW